MSFPAVLLVLSILVAAYLRSQSHWRARSQGLPFPPGPRPLPIIGNLLDTPTFKPWVAYRDLCARYGDIVHLRVLGQSIVVLGKANAITELLDRKRSANTSDRKASPMVELSGSSLNVALMPYGSWWRRHRRAFWQHFHPDASLRYRPIQRRAVHALLRRLLKDPHELSKHVRFALGSVIMNVSYGINVADEDDKFVRAAENAVQAASEGLVPGKFLVEFFPFLRHIPAWLPGASSQRLFAKWQAAGEELKNVPFEYVKRSMDQVDTQRSVVGQLLNDVLNSTPASNVDEEIDVIKNVGATSFEAATDTTFSTMIGAFLALSLHPRVVKKAQDELDVVVSRDRMPDFGDEESLVYINAIVYEALRWHNVTPLSVPHVATEDEIFEGYFIPAGSVIIPNVWACAHDPEVYVNPDEFRPERFIRDGKIDFTGAPDPSSFAFGFGRRLCPGRHFGRASLFMTIASVLHVFDIGPPLDAHGVPIKIVPCMSDGLISYQEDCRCLLKPRSAEAEALIREHSDAVWM